MTIAIAVIHGLGIGTDSNHAGGWGSQAESWLPRRGGPGGGLAVVPGVGQAASGDSRVRSPVASPDEILVRPGPALLSGIEGGASLQAHREQYGALPRVDLTQLSAMTHRVRLRGRGGGGFRFTTKLHATAQGRKHAVVVVNLSESEPGSAKDTALAMMRPHLILDGAAAAASALGAREVQVALSGKRALSWRRDPTGHRGARR